MNPTLLLDGNVIEPSTQLQIERDADGKAKSYVGVGMYGYSQRDAFLIIAADKEAMARVMASFDWRPEIHWEQVKPVKAIKP